MKQVETTAVAGNELAAAALDYARRGWAVFPVRGKAPLTPNGLKDATTNAERIAEWWRRHREAGVAIRTGRESALYVLDVDGDQGADALHELERERGELPLTPRAVTGGGGMHYYFKRPGGEHRNTAGKIAPGVDTRCDNGYCVAAPSPHPSGRRYEWDVPPDECELALAPAWLTTATAARESRAPRPVSEWRQLAAEGVGKGQRNDRAARLAGHLLAREVDPYVVLELLAAWDERRNRPPLGRDEIARVVDSIAAREAAKWMA